MASLLRGSQSDTSQIPPHTKIVIVGSGAGGALVAMRLAEAGHEVLVVESGAYVPASEMTQREADMMPRLYYDAGLRKSEELSIGIIHGRVVGGSTVVNYLDCFRTPDRLLSQWVERFGLPELAPAQMLPRFERIEAILGVAKMPEYQLNPNNRKLKIGAEALGWSGDTFHRNANNCYGSGFCDLGCAYNAKQSAAITFLPRATAKGATVLAEARVERVVVEGGRATGVEGVLLGEDRAPRGAFSVKADVVIVAGGAIQTPDLLLRSNIEDASAQLGRNLALHPAAPIIGHFKGERIANYEGIKQGYYVDEFSWPLREHPLDVLLEGIGGPPGMSSTIFGGNGATHQRAFQRFNAYAVAGLLLRDHDTGWIEAGRDRPKVHYTPSVETRLRLREAAALQAKLWFAAGATTVLTPHATPVIVRGPHDLSRLDSVGYGVGQFPLFSFHQMGSARMGSRRDRSVASPEGRVWAYPNLFIADASLFPGASGVNPQLTVYGLADVVADGILSSL